MRREFKPVERPEDEKGFSFKNKGDRAMLISIGIIVLIAVLIVALILIFW